jgi:hypothetical protein
MNAAHRRRSPSSGEERPRPMARSPGQITHRAIPVDRNDGPAALRYCNLTARTSPDERAALTPSRQAPISNPHRLGPGARHRRAMLARGFLPRDFSDACRPSTPPRSSAAGIQEALTIADVGACGVTGQIYPRTDFTVSPADGRAGQKAAIRARLFGHAGRPAHVSSSSSVFASFRSAVPKPSVNQP